MSTVTAPHRSEGFERQTHQASNAYSTTIRQVVLEATVFLE